MFNANHKQSTGFLCLGESRLWEKEAQLLPYGHIDFAEVQRLAEEQSVVGLVLVSAGLEHVLVGKPAKSDVLQFVENGAQITVLFLQSFAHPCSPV